MLAVANKMDCKFFIDNGTAYPSYHAAITFFFCFNLSPLHKPMKDTRPPMIMDAETISIDVLLSLNSSQYFVMGGKNFISFLRFPRLL